MKTIGITGGVGAGKSTVLAYLEEKYNAFVIQADEVGHIVMAPGQECYQPVIDLFGKDVIKNDKTIDRKRVSDVVFEQPDFFEPSKWDNSSGCKKIYPEKPGGTEEGGTEAMRCGSRTFSGRTLPGVL